MQTVEVRGEGAKNGGNVRKWCHLFKEGSTMCSHTSPLIYALLNSSAGQFSSILLHTVPFLHPAIITYFSTLQENLANQYEERPKDKRLAERFGSDFS